jgi:hypothetical protein
MDEFDVFLDAVSRRIALSTMVSQFSGTLILFFDALNHFFQRVLHLCFCLLQVEMSKQMVNRQFIFITPQDLSSLQPDNKLKIIVMKPPDRGSGQQVINFTQD